jgi:hypothetical protein
MKPLVQQVGPNTSPARGGELQRETVLHPPNLPNLGKTRHTAAATKRQQLGTPLQIHSQAEGTDSANAITPPRLPRLPRA